MTDLTFSNSAIDRLGKRICEQLTGDDLILLDQYRRSFGSAYDQVVTEVRRVSGVEVSGRPAKSTASIVGKLRRESVRLSQMQDMAGCRLVVENRDAQEKVIKGLVLSNPNAAIFDRRSNPSNGYRAVHLVLTIMDRTVEVQVRTELQHLWAELSEKLSDKHGIEVKYGGGPHNVWQALHAASNAIRALEKHESTMIEDPSWSREFENVKLELKETLVQALTKMGKS